jgi:hypothetical protein
LTLAALRDVCLSDRRWLADAVLEVIAIFLLIHPRPCDVGFFTFWQPSLVKIGRFVRELRPTMRGLSRCQAQMNCRLYTKASSAQRLVGIAKPFQGLSTSIDEKKAHLLLAGFCPLKPPILQAFLPSQGLVLGRAWARHAHDTRANTLKSLVLNGYRRIYNPLVRRPIQEDIVRHGTSVTEVQRRRGYECDRSHNERPGSPAVASEAPALGGDEWAPAVHHGQPKFRMGEAVP